MVSTADRSDRFERSIQWIGAASMAGVFGGLVAGVAARIAMHLFAEGIGRATEFTVGGTFGIILVGAIFGAVFGIAYPVVRRLVPGPTVVSGIMFGLLMTALVILPVLAVDSGEAAPDVDLGIRLGAAVMIVFALGTAAADAAIRRLGDRPWTRLGFALSAALALLSSLLVVPALLGAYGTVLERIL